MGGGKGFGVVGSLNLGLGGESSINLPSSVEILARNLSSKADSLLAASCQKVIRIAS